MKGVGEREGGERGGGGGVGGRKQGEGKRENETRRDDEVEQGAGEASQRDVPRDVQSDKSKSSSGLKEYFRTGIPFYFSITIFLHFFHLSSPCISFP